MTQTLIIGAGITGAALAYQLSRRGEPVTIVSTHAEGGLASAASFGWLNASYFLNHPHYHLRREGLAAHRRLTDALPGLPTTTLTPEPLPSSPSAVPSFLLPPDVTATPTASAEADPEAC